MKFKNRAKRIKKGFMGCPIENGMYGYDRPSKYLLRWGTLFQAVISQAGTYLLTGKFHRGQCGIYKAEGGCRIEGVGDLVLLNDRCQFDLYGRSEKILKDQEKLANLITHIVLKWDPEDPINSMIRLASEYIHNTELERALDECNAGGAFGGDALSYFFDKNPFSFKDDSDDFQGYRKFCMFEFEGKSKEEVAQKFSDEMLGKEFLKKLRDKVRKVKENSYLFPMCCKPRRRKNGQLVFWINTGRNTQIDGWKTEYEISDFLRSDGVLKDTALF